MNNVQRREIYLRDRTELTAAQRRRLARHKKLEDGNVIVRMSRRRKVMERAARLKARREGAALVSAMRRGWFQPRTQREMKAAQTLEALKSATANQGPKSVQDDSTVPPR